MLYKIENKKANENNILCRFFYFRFNSLYTYVITTGNQKKKKRKQYKKVYFTHS